MGIIEYKVREAFKNYQKNGDVYEFAREMAHIGDYSVRSMSHWYCLSYSIDKIKEEKEKEVIDDLANFDFSDDKF